jgi:thioredoxin reductase (NADPH)
MNDFDVIIIGGGAAGISAALWCDELALSSVILETGDELGGQLLWTNNAIKNYPGIEVPNGRGLQKVFLNQIASRKLEIKTNSRVVEIDTAGKKVSLENGEVLSAQALIIATGIRRRKLNVEGEEQFQGRGILQSGQGAGEKVAGKRVCVIGGGDAALENALILAEFAAAVTIIHRRKDFRARPEFVKKVQSHPKIKIITEAVVTKFLGTENLEAIELDGKENIPAEAALLRLGVEPNTELLRGQINLDRQGYCQINAAGETNVKKVFAIGDVANPLAPTISGAVGMGATAIKTLFNQISA